MLIPKHLLEIYAEVLDNLESELYVENDRVCIDTLDGKIEIDKEGFINHLEFNRGAKYEQELINFSVYLSNQISPIKRSDSYVF